MAFFPPVFAKTCPGKNGASLSFTQIAAVSYTHLGNGIAIQNGVIQNTGDLSTTNEFQNLSYDANERKLSISNGNTIQFPALNLSKISDIDGNTSIDAEKTVNDDKIRFNLAGDEAVSYTHLDVYKRQMDGHRRFRKRKRQQYSTSYGCHCQKISRN